MAGLELLTPPAMEPLDVALVKEMLRINVGDSSQDNYLNTLIATARETAEMHTSRSYITQTWREYFDHFPGCRFPIPFNVGFFDGALIERRGRHHHHQHFELSRSPLQGPIIQIQYIDPTGATETIDPSVYVVNGKRDPAQIEHAPGVFWPRPIIQVNSIWIDYKVGYSDDQAKVPGVATQAMLMMVNHWYENRSPVQQGGQAEIPLGITALLNKNRVYYQP